MSCKLDSRFIEAKDVATINTTKTVKMSSLLSASDVLRAKNYAVLLVNIPTESGEKQYFRATMNSQVPTNTEVIRSNDGQLVGIPTVAGG